MKNDKDYIFVRSLIDKYRLNEKYFHLDEKYLSSYVDRIVYEYRVMDTLTFVTSKWSRVSSYFLKVFIILGGAFLSVIKSQNIKKSIVLVNTSFDSDIIALPFADNVMRMKRLRDLCDMDIDICYHPHFHFQSLQKQIDYYNSRSESVYLDYFRLSDTISLAVKMLANSHQLRKCSKELDHYFNSNTCKLPGIVIVSVLYRQSMTRLLKRMVTSQTSKIWLMDFCFELKYITFNDVIHKQRPQDKTIHRSFFTYQPAYCNPCCDISLCCSPREKDIIDQNNKYKSRIEYLGAPLQSFIDKSNADKVESSFDILFLMTDTYSAEIKMLQTIFLKGFDFLRHKVLVRYRPFIGGATVSNGTTLTDDVKSAKTIVSFSEDALYIGLRYNKRIVVICSEDPKETYNFDNSTSNIIITNHPSVSKSLDWDAFIGGAEECDYNTDNFALYNFGINNFEQLRIRFKEILTTCL